MTAIEMLMTGLVDYAGLFPPAAEDMRTAVENFATYRAGPDRHALGRFIVPLARLEEFEAASREVMKRGDAVDPWRLSVLVGADTHAASERMLKFNCHHWSGSEDGHALIDVVELKAPTVEAIEEQHRNLPSFFQRYFEVSLDGSMEDLIKAIAHVGARAKIRTGGTTPDAFPRSPAIFAFMAACKREGVAFKATAGLHHPIRGSYRLTYQRGSAAGTMYGFLNLFVAAALVQQGEAESTVVQALEETDPRAFRFTDEAITWNGHRIDASELRTARDTFAISFGSCSFREPVDELTQLVSRNA